MTVAVDLDAKTEELLRKAAMKNGVELDEYLRSLIDRDLRRLTLDERLAPVRKSVAESDMTEEELDEFFEGVRQRAFEERYPRGRP